MLSIWFQLTYCVLEKNTQHQKPCCRKSVGIVPCNKELFKLSDLILCSVMPLNTEPNWCHSLVSILSHCYNYVYWVDSSTVSLCSCLVVCGHVMHPYGSDKDFVYICGRVIANYRFDWWDLGLFHLHFCKKPVTLIRVSITSWMTVSCTGPCLSWTISWLGPKHAQPTYKWLCLANCSQPMTDPLSLSNKHGLRASTHVPETRQKVLVQLTVLWLLLTESL